MTVIKSCDMETILSEAQLPALPQSAVHLLELSRTPSNGPNEYASPIEADPGLAGQILKFVNSSYFGFRSEVTSIRHALSLVGIRTIKNFALWSAVFSLVPGMKSGRFDIKLLWFDALRRALFAQRIGKVLHVETADDLFTAGLLQDLAVPILMKELANEYPPLYERRWSERRELSNLEKETLGWTHAQAGAFIAKRWKLPESLGRLIESHDKIDERWLLSKALGGQLAVSLSALLPESACEEWIDSNQFRGIYDQLPSESRPDLKTLFAEIDEDMGQFGSVIKLTTPALQLCSFLE